MKVSTIIPTLNESPHIAQAIERAWEAGADEVIVVDGGSRDGTAEIARDLHCQFVKSQAGRAVQQNLGAASTQGEVLLFLHADTWLPPGGIDQIRRALGDGDVAGGAFHQKIEAQGRVYRWLEHGNAWRARRRGLPYGDQGIFMRRRVFDRLGGFPKVRLMEDLLLMKKFRRLAWPVLLPGPLHVSARRWQKYGPLRQTARNWLLLSAAWVGVSPDRLATYYAPHE